MSDFLDALRADLLDRRMLPALLALTLALAVAVGYAVFGGGSPAAQPPTPARVLAGVPGLAVSKAPANPNLAVAETTNGTSQQRHGFSRDPFAPLPVPVSKAAGVVSSKTAANVPAEGAKTGSNVPTKAGGTTPTTPVTPTTPTPTKPPSKPHTVYHVAVLFGVVPVGTPPQLASLTPFEGLKLFTPLPSASQALLVFRGVTTGGRSAAFSVVGEAILHGAATCLPTPSQCQAITLAPGQTEQLEYLTSSNQIVTYELRLASITASKASTASLKRARSASRVGLRVLKRAGLLALPGMRFSAPAGLLVPLHPHAVGVRAHTALLDPLHKR